MSAVHGDGGGHLDERALAAGHEPDAISGRLLWVGGAVLVALVVVAVGVVFLLQPLLVSRQEAENPPPNPLAATYGRSEPPAPRLQVDPALDIVEHRRREEQLLTTYGWVDEKAGVVRIPVARAIDILAERGLPEPPAAAAAQGAGRASGGAGTEAVPSAGEGVRP